MGEDGAVKIGFSRGYASPEHYGYSYISQKRTSDVGKFTFSKEIKGDYKENEEDKTELLLDSTEHIFVDDDKTEVLTEENNFTESKNKIEQLSLNSASKTKSNDGIMLDVRSDIYSLGATLYHLISGNKPSQEADKVLPLGKEVCSPAVAAIIQKAMSPDPAMRYESAEEMRQAFLDLYKKDKRVLSLKYYSI